MPTDDAAAVAVAATVTVTAAEQLGEQQSQQPSKPGPKPAIWTSEEEELIAGIGDRCNGYQWLHTQCQTRFECFNFYLTIPSIAVTAIAGSLTIGLNSLVPSGYQTYATTVLGAMTIGTGVLTTLNQYMKSAHLVEAHKIAALSYGKLYRLILTELSLHRSSRGNPQEFLKMVRTEQDRLQETSPTVLPHIIEHFKNTFKGNTQLQKPEITGDLDHIIIPLTGPHTPTPPDTPVSRPPKKQMGQVIEMPDA